MKNLIFGAIILLALPAFADAQVYGGCNGGFFFPCGGGIGAPREELVVFSFGPGGGSHTPSYGYQPAPQYMPMQYQQPIYYQQPYAYQQPNYFYQQPNYFQQPQYYHDPYSYYQPTSYDGYGGGYNGGYPRSMGTSDLFGTPLCDWGGTYQGYACGGSHPAQWILDPYTGTYY